MSPTSPIINNANSIYGTPTIHQPIYATPSQDLSGNVASNGRNYHAEYREKYGYTATYGRSSFQTMGFVSSAISTPKSPEPKSSSTVASTMRYTDWFGSVTARRPSLRPQLPSFSNMQGNAIPEKSVSAWNHYMSVEQTSPIPVQVYSNVCVCIDQNYGTTKGKKKKKCKRCGLKPASLRYATTSGGQVRMRPSLSAVMYQPPVQQATTTWGWAVREEQVYGHYGGNSHQRPVSFPTFSSPQQPSSEEEDSPPPTPETVRSMRSIKSARSNDSNITLTKDNSEPLRPAPPPPKIPEDNGNNNENSKKRSSIIANNVSAYQLIEDHSLSSDTDGLSDNAVDEPPLNPKEDNRFSNNVQSDNISTTSTLIDESNEHSDDSQVSKVRVITINGNNYDNSDKPNSIITSDSENNKIRISTSSPHKIVIGNDSSELVNSLNKKNSSLNVYESQTSNKNKIVISSSNDKNGVKIVNGDVNRKSEVNINVNKNNYNDDIRRKNNRNNRNSRSNKTISSNSTDVVNNTEKQDSTSILLNSGSLQIPRPNRTRKNGINKSSVQSHPGTSPVKKKISPKSSAKFNKQATIQQKRLSTNSIEEDDILNSSNTSEIHNVGNTVRISGQRSTILNDSPLLQAKLSSEYSSDDENNVDNNEVRKTLQNSSEDYNDDTSTSDYPLSSPATTHESDSDTNQDDYDVYHNSRYICNDLWNSRSTPTMRDVIYEEDENDENCEFNINTNNVITINGNGNEIEKDAGKQNDIDQTSVSSSSISSPDQQTIFHPTLSELLQVKSILKRPNSLDTSSETDSDFYLPTFNEFKQNNRKKKQVQFHPSHEVNVVEDMGETKGRKVSSLKNTRKDKDKQVIKDNDNSTYNLIADLQDVYFRKDNSNFKDTKNASEYRNTYDLNLGRKLSQEAERIYVTEPMEEDRSFNSPNQVDFRESLSSHLLNLNNNKLSGK